MEKNTFRNRKGLRERSLLFCGCLATMLSAWSYSGASGFTPASPTPSPSPSPTFTCERREEAVTIGTNTGCDYGGSCPWYSPNQGLYWTRVYECKYNPVNGQLLGLCSQPACTSYHSGCCNDIDTASHCKTGDPYCPSP